MSIVALDKVTVVGHMRDKEEVLAGLQEFGCMHLIPLTPEGEAAAEAGPSKEAREALRFLASTPQRRRQVTDPRRFDARGKHLIDHCRMKTVIVLHAIRLI